MTVSTIMAAIVCGPSYDHLLEVAEVVLGALFVGVAEAVVVGPDP
jgi:hypothetical protein